MSVHKPQRREAMNSRKVAEQQFAQRESSPREEAVSSNHHLAKQALPKISSPELSLPKGGGAIQSIDEKFSVNSATGTAALTIPVYTSPGRQEFHPQLALSYDSGAGNGPFGVGFSLSLPSITRKTAKGIPTYRDAEEADTFILSGAEDLVPVYVQEEGEWVREVFNRTEDDVDYVVHRYRPRIEGLFARIERWTHVQTRMTHWRSVTKEHVTSIYGMTEQARLAHPKHPEKVFQWRLEQSYDPKGNIIFYEYKQEDMTNVSRQSPQESHRLTASPLSNSYIKRIKYGNQTPFQADQWLFEVVFDYGDHTEDAPTPEATRGWQVRKDPFSSYRSGFEIRTYRLCKRILMFHHMDQLGDQPCLVRATNMEYEHRPTVTTLVRLNQTGFRQSDAGEYEQQSLPSLELTYSQPILNDNIASIDKQSVQNVPRGVDGDQYRWVDLDGEGLPGILTQQANEWYYKRNRGGGQFEALECVDPIPSTAHLRGGMQQLTDVTGNGQLDLMQLDATRSGFFERTEAGSWKSFVPLQSIPNLDWQDANLRFIDLSGDGRPDILLTEDNVFTYYPAKGEQGFGLPEHVKKAFDEEQGPNLVFSDATQSIYLADMSGDGLTDIVRIRNGEVCYWPNIGYGHFGAKVTMAHSPRLAPLDQFDHARIRLADVDGSGTTDIIYLDKKTVSIWFNQAGNSWSRKQEIFSFPPVDNVTAVQVTDLLGLGTASLVWSSPLPTQTEQPLMYMDLMGGRKAHLLTSIQNNMGSEKKLHYTSSTKFYLEDKKRGQPWITKLPFPVHVVERVETIEHVTAATYTTRYKYHHGYFDGKEREFHGFGLVEQWDADHYLAHADEGGQDEALHQPPVLSKTWFHTGAFIGRKRMTDHYRMEYYNRDEEAHSLPDTPFPLPLTNEEKRQACRAMKGKVLRTEIYALDEKRQSEHPYQVTEHAYRLQHLQPVQGEQDAVFHVYHSETLTHHYERNPSDPRIHHDLTLHVDHYGNVTQAVAIAYPRRTQMTPAEDDFAPQGEMKITCTEADYVNKAERDVYRVGVLTEQRAYEVTALSPLQRGLFTIDELIEALSSMEVIPFEATSSNHVPQKRLYERSRIRYWKDDLSGPLPEGDVEARALPYETYEMAFTPALLANTYNDHVDTALLSDGGYVEMDGGWWLPSGRQTFDPGQFYVPVAFMDPFGATHTMTYDHYALLPTKTVTPAPLSESDVTGNVTLVENNYRVLQAEQITDPNGNRSTVRFDALGMVVATAVMGKASETKGDSLANFQDTRPDDISTGVADPHQFLQEATTRYIIDLDRFRRLRQPVGIHTIVRETHRSELRSDEETAVQQQVSYWDGLGREVMTKMKAEPGKAPVRDPQTDAVVVIDGDVQMADTEGRWIGSGRTVYDNKGNPVKQYEPFFSDRHDFEDEALLAMWGVTPIMSYDPLGRLIRTDHPDGTFSTVSFDAWKEEKWDANDTVQDSDWYRQRKRPDPEADEPSDPEERAAWLTAKHARTPSLTYQDSLGRTFINVEDNGDEGAYRQRLDLDITGNPLVVSDAKQREVMTSQYDMLGRLIESNSVDKGRRWMFPSIDGQPFRQWDSRGHWFEMRYDPLRRPVETWIQKDNGAYYLAEKYVYGEHHPNAMTDNLRGNIYEQYDQAGLIVYETYDFKGNSLRQRRQLTQGYDDAVDWSINPEMESESFVQESTFDALDRLVSQCQPDQSNICFTYNATGRLDGVQAYLRGSSQPTPFVHQIDYNAKGQRERIVYDNTVHTYYSYDQHTFRLARLETIRSSDGVRLQDLRYTYDPVGNITEIRDDAQQTVYFKNNVIHPHSKFVYDPLYRLKKAEGREGAIGGNNGSPGPGDIPYARLPHANDKQALRRYVEHYDYDEVGNMLRMAHHLLNSDLQDHQWTRHYQYELENHRLRSTSLPGDDPIVTNNSGGTYSARYDYDTHGNMIRMPHIPQLVWDAKDQLKKVDLAGGGKEYYTYDFAGQRVRKVHEHNGSTVEERIYLGGFELYRKHREGKLVLERESLHVMDGEARIAVVETKTFAEDEAATDASPVLRYQYSDHLQSSSLELDEGGHLITYEAYLPFGGTAYRSGRNEAETSLKRYRYTGKERDESTGLYYYGARYYLAWLGRWASADPAGLVDGPNVYAYVANNPIVLTDPEGLEGEKVTEYTFEEGMHIRGRIYDEQENGGGQENSNGEQEGGLLSRALRLPGAFADLVDEGKEETYDFLRGIVHNPEEPMAKRIAVGLGGSILGGAMELGSMVVDPLRIGRGISRGGWGYGEDLLRSLSFLGPLAKGASYAGRGARAVGSRIPSSVGETVGSLRAGFLESLPSSLRRIVDPRVVPRTSHRIRFSSNLGENTLGRSMSKTGDIYLHESLRHRPKLGSQVLRHEIFHSTITTSLPESVRPLRTGLYRHSQLYRFIEETGAQTFGTASPFRGLSWMGDTMSGYKITIEGLGAEVLLLNSPRFLFSFSRTSNND